LHFCHRPISNPLFLAVPIGNCVWVRYVGYIFPFTVPITLLLFIFRVYALFRNRSSVLVFVFLSWLLVVGSSVAVAVRTEGVNLPGTDFCIKRLRERDIPGALSTITRFIHDTLVFVMTSWWLYQSNSSDRHGLKTVVFGRHLFPLTRSLLHDGQAYYLSVFSLLTRMRILIVSLQCHSCPQCLGHRFTLDGQAFRNAMYPGQSARDPDKQHGIPCVP
jgi:hypothetical protein